MFLLGYSLADISIIDVIFMVLFYFVFFVSSCYVDERVIKSEKRYYFDGNKMIQFLDGKKNVKSGTEEFINEENAIKHQISELKIYTK